MSTHHEVPLARQVVAEKLTAAACKGKGEWWARREAAHARARTKKAAGAAAAPALKLCRSCPAYEACEIWAQLDDYTGLAAGSAYLNGRPVDPARVRQLSTPPKNVA